MRSGNVKDLARKAVQTMFAGNVLLKIGEYTYAVSVEKGRNMIIVFLAG